MKKHILKIIISTIYKIKNKKLHNFMYKFFLSNYSKQLKSYPHNIQIILI